MKSNSILYIFLAITILSTINCHINEPDIQPIDDSGNLSGIWLGVGYQCPLGTFHVEQVSIQDDGTNVVATKINGDPCVTSGIVTFSGVKNDSSDIFDITFTTGSLLIPNSSTAEGTLSIIDNNKFVTTSTTTEEIIFSRIKSKVKFWINAFIPKDIAGYTQDAPSPYIGQTMIQYNVPLNPGNINQYCAFTDQRTFSVDFFAKHRMQSSLEIIYLGDNEIEFFTNHDIDPTHEIICETGFGGCFITGSTDEMLWENPTIEGGVFKIDINAKSNNPCSFGNGWSPDIDYVGTLIIGFNTKSLSFAGYVDNFPAFEAYAEIDGDTIHTVFQEFDDTKTVLNLMDTFFTTINEEISW
jgi:hypothetical protein